MRTPPGATPAAGLFADPDGDSLTVTATLSDGSPLPSWLTFDGSTFTGTPPANFNGSVAITLTATDPSAASVSQAFTLTVNPVNDAPVVATPVASQSVDEDTAWSYTLPAGLFADPDGDSLTLTAKLSDGSPLPSWLTFDGSTFTGTPPANFNGAVGITLTATDPSAAFVSRPSR